MKIGRLETFGLISVLILFLFAGTVLAVTPFMSERARGECVLQSDVAIQVTTAEGTPVGFLYPGDRARSLLERDGLRLIVTDENLAGWIPAGKWCK